MFRFGRGALPLALLAAVVLAGPSAGYGGRVFGANDQTSGAGYDVDTTTILIVTTTHEAAQRFSPAEAFVLWNVTLYVANVGGQADALNVTIQGDSGGAPDGTVLAWSEASRSGTGWLDFPLTPRPTLDPGLTYWIVAGNDAQQGYLWIHSNADTVPGESAQASNSNWGTPTDIDLTYVTFGVRLEPKITVGLSADRRSVPPGGSVTLTVYVNNTGARPAPYAWVNLTLPVEMTAVGDSAATLNGTALGPSSWRFPQLPNGANAFTATIAVDPMAPGGAFLISTAHLDYTDSSGSPQAPSTAMATVIVSLKSKPMYLAHDAIPGGTWDRLIASPPSGALEDFEGDGNDGMTVGSSGANWTLVPGFARAFRIRGTAAVELFLNAPNGGGSTAILDVSLVDVRGVAETPVVSVQVTVSVDGNLATYQLQSVDLGTVDHLFLKSNATELRISKVSGADLWVGYNRTDVPSRVVVTTSTYISIDRVTLLDARGPAAGFSSQDTVRVDANVSDPFGNGEIAGVAINLTDPDGTFVVTLAALSRIAADPNGTWALYEYAYARPARAGAWTYLLTATEGNGVEVTGAGAFPVAFPVLALAVSADVPEPRVGGIVSFTITFVNTGTATASLAWINATLPSGLSYVSDTSGGFKTGASNWTIPDVEVGFHAFVLVALVDRAPANGSLFVRFDLEYADAKGFAWVALARSTELTVVAPSSPPPTTDPVLFVLLGFGVAGGLAGGYWMWRSRRPVIEEAFLLHRDGILLYHVSRSLATEDAKDKDILGAMLTAVQEFVKESFKYGENRELQTLEFGDYHVVIERGEHIFLAGVVAGSGAQEARRKLRWIVEEVEAKFGNELKDFSGEMERILGVRDIVKRLIGRA